MIQKNRLFILYNNKDMDIKCLYDKSKEKKAVNQLPSLAKNSESQRSKIFNESVKIVTEANAKILLKKKAICN